MMAVPHCNSFRPCLVHPVTFGDALGAAFALAGTFFDAFFFSGCFFDAFSFSKDL